MRCHLYEIHAPILRQAQCLPGWVDTQLRAIPIDHSDFADPNLAIESMFPFTDATTSLMVRATHFCVRNAGNRPTGPAKLWECIIVPSQCQMTFRSPSWLSAFAAGALMPRPTSALVLPTLIRENCPKQ